MSRNQPFTAPLKEGEVRWVVLSYDGEALTMLIDGKCAGNALVFNVASEQEQDLAASSMIGTGLLGLGYDGSVQQFSVLRWASARSDSDN
jgi:hypothetical protein